MTSSSQPAASSRLDPQIPLALAALVAGAVAMGISPVFVRFAEVGPYASAFWRVALSLPLLALWAAGERRSSGHFSLPGWNRATVIAGLLFTGDLFFWHLAILNTTAANATFFATMAPVWVMLGSGLLIREAVTRAMVTGLGFCLAGAFTLIGSSMTVAPDRLVGDLYGILTSLFFGGYFLAMRFARRDQAATGPGVLLYRSSLVTAAALFVIAVLMGDDLLPTSWRGAAALIALAVISHAGGQGLLAYALGTLSAGFSSLVIFLEAVAAAAFGWLLLDEPLVALQVVGGAIILTGIYIARPRARQN